MALDGPRTREYDLKPPRSNGGKSVTAGRHSRFQLTTLGAKTAAAIGIGGAAVLVVGGILLTRTGVAIRDLERSQYAGIAADARVRLDQLVGRDRNRMMDAAFSDGLYDLLARGAAPPDSFIRPVFTGQFPAQYGDRFVAIYDLSGRRVYAWTDSGQSELETVATNPLFRILDNREPASGLVRQGEKLFWVAGAPVLPTNYTAPEQPIRGYVVVAQPFNPGLVSPATSGRSGRVELTALEPAKEGFRTRVGPAATRDSARVEFALADIFARQNTLVAVTTSRAEFGRLEGRLLTLALVGILAIAALAWAGFRAATRFLVGPVARLSQALAPVHSGQTPGLIGSIAPAAEWTSVVQAVNRLVSNSRSFSDHFERLAGVVADGAWERDLGSGEWTVTSRFRELVGYQAGEFATPLAALTARLDPDDAAQVVPWIQADLPNPRTLAADVRVRRGGGVTWLRIEGELTADTAGLPARVIGRVSDLTAVRQAEADALAAARSNDGRRAAEGRFLAGLAPHLTADPAAAQQLAFIGQGMAGTLGATPVPCDLYGLLQEAAGGGDLSIAPAVPAQVEGDRVLLKSAIDLLLKATDRAIIRADQPDRSHPERIRITIEDRTPADPDALAAIGATLTTGQHQAGDSFLAWGAVHHLARALGGDAGVEATPTGTRRWITVPLRPMPTAEPSPVVEPTFQTPPAWNGEPSAVTFTAEPRPEPAPRPARPSGRVELIADATVTINLDDTVPAGARAPIGARFLARLQADDRTARQAARAAGAEIPARLTELKGAVKAGEIGGVIDGAEAVARIAEAIEATEVAARCRDLIDAAENQYLDAGDELVLALDGAWHRTAEALAPYMPEPSHPSIDPAMLEQLSASLGEGGLGAQLVGLFLAGGPGQVEAIEGAAGRADWQAVKANAGDLQGMCALIGAAPLAARCAAAIEAVGSDAWTEALAIRTEWDRVSQVLDSLMGARTGAVT